MKAVLALAVLAAAVCLSEEAPAEAPAQPAEQPAAAEGKDISPAEPEAAVGPASAPDQENAEFFLLNKLKWKLFGGYRGHYHPGYYRGGYHGGGFYDHHPYYW